MPRRRQNDHERAVGIVQTGITRQVVADHFNVSRITISRLMIRLRQTGRTNDRPRNDRPRVTSQYQNRHLRLIHLRYRMITAEDTARRTYGLSNIRISGQNVRRTPRQSGFRARRPAVGPVLKQRHRTARLAWAHARRHWRLHTWQHILFSDQSRFSLCFSDGRYRVYRRRWERFTCVRVRPFWRRKCYVSSSNNVLHI
jgi:transposase